MMTNTKFVSLKQAAAAVDTYKDIQADAQDCLQAQNPQELVPALLIRYRKLLASLHENFGWYYDDPTRETFRACHTPLNALQLAKMIRHTLRTLGQGDAPIITASIEPILNDAVQTIATSPTYTFIAKNRDLKPIAGYGLPNWITNRDDKQVFGVNIEFLLAEFDRLLSGLDLPAGWQDPTLRIRAEFDTPRESWQVAETILDSLVYFVGPHCNDTYGPLARRADSESQRMQRYRPAILAATG